ncbi:host attachment protein [Nitrobacter sp.]|uniref:host attachment protein n=1 Tax=Nitrobacter sp. TaxID=29420 RepID=UPI00321FA771
MEKTQLSRASGEHVQDSPQCADICRRRPKGLVSAKRGRRFNSPSEAEEVFEDTNPITHEQGSDRLGRVIESSIPRRKSAVEQIDWHNIEEHRFAQTVAAAMEQMVRMSKARVLIVVAPPRTLADLPVAFHPT